MTAEDALAESERRFRTVVNALDEGLSIQDADGIIVTVNDATCRILGMSREQIVGVPAAHRPWGAVRPDGSPIADGDNPSVRAQRTGETQSLELIGIHRPDGERRWLRLTSTPLLGINTPYPTGTVSLFVDVTDELERAATLAESEVRFRLAMRQAPIGMTLVGLDGRFLVVNPALCRITGYSEGELLARTFQDITHPDDLGADITLLGDLVAGRIDHYAMDKRYRRKDGVHVWVHLSVSAMRNEDSSPQYFISQIEDINEAKLVHAQLSHLALHDQLTGLPNRVLTLDRLGHALDSARRTGNTVAVLFCDIDRFKVINDSLGHTIGDNILKAVAERLGGAVRPGDSVGRIGGDEFVLVCEHIADPSQAIAIADRVSEVLATPIRVGSTTVTVRRECGCGAQHRRRYRTRHAA